MPLRVNIATKSEHTGNNIKLKRSANNIRKKKKRERANKGKKIVVTKVKQLHYAQPSLIK